MRRPARWCGPTRLHKLNAPLLILIGEADDWMPASRCRDMLRRSGLDESARYSEAYYRFDIAEAPQAYLSYTIGRHPEAAARAETDARHFLTSHLKSDR